MNRKPSRHSRSIWLRGMRRGTLPELTGDIATDVCVIGAGIAGLSTAYLLSREGKSVVVIDDGQIGGGQTERTTAHLTNALDDRYFLLEDLHGEEGARLAAESHTAAIDRIETIARHETIECDFERVDGFLFVPPGEAVELLDRELQAVRRAGLRGVELLSRPPLDTFDLGTCLKFPNQAQFHPLRYLRGLARAIERNGGRIFTNAHAVAVEGGERARVETKNGPVIKTQSVVVATNTPINDLIAIHTKQAAYTTYAIAARIAPGAVPHALFWDTGSSDHAHPAPYHYVRLQRAPASRPQTSPRDEDEYELLIAGGEDHKTGQASDAHLRYARLEAWVRERFPIDAVELRWSGQVMEPVDGLAFIGPNPMDKPNVYVATGDSGNGLTHGTIAGVLLTDLIMRRENAWSELYTPSRKPLGAVLDYASENLNAAGQYATWLTRGELATTDEIDPGSGAVIRSGLTKVAVYRDSDGVLHEFSAVCPHLGCIVAWNDFEKTWDCPCHGSRFDTEGRVLQGPANRDLAPAYAESHHAST
jgi:glycine/D-amino acid oxidase-like deaminating enzyme/nitrite reductase/ring-hydroxylating ferredoxin subunit